MSIVAKSPSVRGASESTRSTKRSRSESTCAVDRVVVDRAPLELDAQGVVAHQPHDGADLDDGVELDVARLLPRSDLDLGRGDRVDVVLGHRRRRSSRAGRPAAPGRERHRRRGAPRASGAAPCPGRKPGIFTSPASLRNAASMACSNSAAGTATRRRTLLSSRASTVVSIREVECTRGLRRPGHPGGVPPRQAVSRLGADARLGGRHRLPPRRSTSARPMSRCP